MAIGIPCSGPRVRPAFRSASSAAASSSAFGLSEMNALIIGPRWSYASMRARYCSTSCREVVVPAAIAFCSSRIDFSKTSKRGRGSSASAVPVPPAGRPVWRQKLSQKPASERASEPRARLRAGGASARSRRSFQRRRKRSAPAQRRARERAGESEGRQPLGYYLTGTRCFNSSNQLIATTRLIGAWPSTARTNRKRPSGATS